MPHNRREVVESRRFSRERDELQPDVERWDEIFFGIDWALCQNPEEVGKETSVPGIRAIPIILPPGEGNLLVYYTYNDERVTLLSVREAEPEPEG